MDEENPSDSDLAAKKKVVSFPKKSKRPAPVPEAQAPAEAPKADPEVVKYLATLLERAKRGEVQGFGVAFVGPDFVARHSLYVASGEYRNTLVAAVAYLAHDLVSGSIHEEDEDDTDADDAPTLG